MVEISSAAAIPLAFGLVFALILLGARAFGVGRARSNREIGELVATTSIISTAATVGRELDHQGLAMAMGIALSLGISVLLRQVLA